MYPYVCTIRAFIRAHRVVSLRCRNIRFCTHRYKVSLPTAPSNRVLCIYAATLWVIYELELLVLEEQKKLKKLFEKKKSQLGAGFPTASALFQAIPSMARCFWHTIGRSSHMYEGRGAFAWMTRRYLMRPSSLYVILVDFFPVAVYCFLPWTERQGPKRAAVRLPLPVTRIL